MLIHESARHLARHAWVERRLFEVVGGWALAEADPDATRVLAAQAQHHAWHADLFDEQVPVLHDLDPAELEAPAPLVTLLDRLAAATGTLERLAGLVRVILPEQLARYEADLAASTPVADAPVIRALRLVVADEQDDWRVAAALLREHLGSEAALARVAVVERELELHLLAVAR